MTGCESVNELKAETHLLDQSSVVLVGFALLVFNGKLLVNLVVVRFDCHSFSHCWSK